MTEATPSVLRPLSWLWRHLLFLGHGHDWVNTFCSQAIVMTESTSSVLRPLSWLSRHLFSGCFHDWVNTFCSQAIVMIESTPVLRPLSWLSRHLLFSGHCHDWVDTCSQANVMIESTPVLMPLSWLSRHLFSGPCHDWVDTCSQAIVMTESTRVLRPLSWLSRHLFSGHCHDWVDTCSQAIVMTEATPSILRPISAVFPHEVLPAFQQKHFSETWQIRRSAEWKSRQFRRRWTPLRFKVVHTQAKRDLTRDRREISRVTVWWATDTENRGGRESRQKWTPLVPRWFTSTKTVS